MKWLTKSGKELDIDSMDTDHIYNTIFFLEKRYGKEQLELLETRVNRPDVIMSLSDKTTVNQYQYLKRTLAIRRLDKNSREILEDNHPINILSIL